MLAYELSVSVNQAAYPSVLVDLLSYLKIRVIPTTLFMCIYIHTSLVTIFYGMIALILKYFRPDP